MTISAAPLAWDGPLAISRSPDQWGMKGAPTTTGLTLGYIGGLAMSTVGVLSLVADGTVTLTDNATNYVQRTYAGVVSTNTTGFLSTNVPMFVAVTAGGLISTFTDYRPRAMGPLSYYPLLPAEGATVTSIFYPYNDPRRFGCACDGVTDDSANFANCMAAAVAGSTITIPPGTTMVLGATGTFPKMLTIVFDGATIQAKAGSAVAEVLKVTDVGGCVIRGGTIDMNNTATSGITGFANTTSPDGLWFDRVTFINEGGALNASNAGLRINSSDSGVTKRFKNVKVTHCRAKNCSSLGSSIAFVDGVELIDWRAENIGLHGMEFVGCTDVEGTIIKGKNCGGSVCGVGAQTYNFDLSMIRADNCSGDGAITVEATSSYGTITNWRAINCTKPGINVSFGSAGAPPNDEIHTVEISHGFARAITPLAISAISKSNPAVFTTPSTALLNFNTISLSIMGATGMTQMNAQTGVVTVLSSTTFSMPIDSTGFSTYTGGAVAAVFNPGVNAYGSSPTLATNVRISDTTVDGFNGGYAMRFMQGSGAHDLRATNLQGPNSYVFIGQEMVDGTFADITCDDSNATHPNGPFQFTALGGLFSDDLRLSRLHCKLCRQADGTTFTPLVYVEGGGSLISVDDVSTLGALNYLSIASGSPNVELSRAKGSITSTAVGGAGTPTMVQQNGNWGGAQDMSVTGGRRTKRLPAAPTSGAWSQGDRVENVFPTVGQPKAWSCTVTGTPGTWVSEGNL